ncbi:nuclear transport factor 2 family protein [Actinophytocola sp.]|uniref:nuclear transport factor 2 family protein n=1 Tax=Actinophytocola sp. TaxID=1872138 RepID=UPI002ED43463
MSQLEATVKELINNFDSMNFAASRELLAPDSQGIDEISHRWLRTADEIGEYFGQLESSVSDLSTKLSDLREQTWGEVGLVTCWLEQDYTMRGTRQHVSSPTTFVLRRIDDRWKVALVHSIPLPEGD